MYVYNIKIKRYRLPKIVSEITFNVTLKAEVPCISTNQQDKVVDKVNTTIATNKGDQTFVS